MPQTPKRPVKKTHDKPRPDKQAPVKQAPDKQGQINFLLVDVHQRVIWTLKEVLKFLKPATEQPLSARQLKDVEYRRLRKALADAEIVLNRVAGIIPPGCVPPDPPPLPDPPGGDPGRYTPD